uniref:Uncharacterized protein n=1 Tax=Micrurus lemniscatus lemniscatus TaxID=129467 RepID=A0A2D4H7W7_MICLE
MGSPQDVEPWFTQPSLRALLEIQNPKLTPEPGFTHGKGNHLAIGSVFLVKASWETSGELKSSSKKWAPVKWRALGLVDTLTTRGDPPHTHTLIKYWAQGHPCQNVLRQTMQIVSFAQGGTGCRCALHQMPPWEILR